MHIRRLSSGNVSVGMLVDISIYLYTRSCLYICLDLYMCMKVNIHVCP